MRNAIAVMLAIAMLVTSVVIALDLAALPRAPLHAVATDFGASTGANHEPLLRAFYDEANTLLAGEHAPMLATVVSPEVETHAAAGSAVRGEAGLRGYLESSRQHGAISLAVVQVIAGGADSAVVVDAREQPSLRRRRVDLFRIEGGMIVGYWPGAASANATMPLPTITMPVSSETLGVSLTRLELGPGAEPTTLSSPIPHVLLIESGVLTISRKHSFQLARAGESNLALHAADPGAKDMLLGPGDALLFSESASYPVWNDGLSSASALSLLAVPQAVLFQQVRAGSYTRPSVKTMHDGWRVGRRIAWDNNTFTETLAVKHLPDSPMTGIELQSSQISVESGQRVPPLPPGKLRLAIVRSGVVGVSVINSDAVSIAAPNPDSQLAVAANHLFWAGDAFWIEAVEAPVLANAGVTPLDILLIDVVPLEAESGATPASYATEPLET